MDLAFPGGMEKQTRPQTRQERIDAGILFVGALARRMAAQMPHSVDVGDLVQDGMIGLIAAADRFDSARGIKFETFAERRVRGAMIDALRRGAWPRGIRRVRREVNEAREKLRLSLGGEPSTTDIARHLRMDERKLTRTLRRIGVIEATSPLATSDMVEAADLPPVMSPSTPPAPDVACERGEVQDRIRAAIAALPEREQKVVRLYYYGDVTMKEIGAEIGVNESRVSQIRARAIGRLRGLLAPDLAPEQFSAALTPAPVDAAPKRRLQMAKAGLASCRPAARVAVKRVAVR